MGCPKMDKKIVYPPYAQREIKRSVNTVTQKVILKTLIRKSILTEHRLSGIKMASVNQTAKIMARKMEQISTLLLLLEHIITRQPAKHSHLE